MGHELSPTFKHSHANTFSLIIMAAVALRSFPVSPLATTRLSKQEQATDVNQDDAAFFLFSVKGWLANSRSKLNNES